MMNFSEALNELKQGAAVHRAGWNAGGMFVIMVPGTDAVEPREGSPYAATHVSPSGVVNIKPHLDFKNAQGDMQPGWVPSQSDLFAEDWFIL